MPNKNKGEIGLWAEALTGIGVGGSGCGLRKHPVSAGFGGGERRDSPSLLWYGVHGGHPTTGCRSITEHLIADWNAWRQI